MKRLLSLLLAAVLGCSLAVPAAALELEDAKELLAYYYLGDLPPNFEGMETLEEILAAINDPYTVYLTAEEYSSMLTDLNGESVVGIGVTIRKIYQDEGYPIISVIRNSPADAAGLEANDLLLAVDGVPMTPDTDPVQYVSGEEGSKVTLTIRKASTGRTREVTLRREEVLIPIVDYRMEGDALVITCDSFGDTAPQGFFDAIEEYGDSASAILVDLRGNPGGTAPSAAGCAAAFLGPGDKSYFQSARGSYSRVVTTEGQPDLTDLPTVVLTSGYSASGSELFAGALRDKKAAIAIGQRTYGKGVAQYILNENSHPEYFDGDCLKVTAQRFFSPKGITNDSIGILPTLTLSSQNVAGVALLLSTPVPDSPEGFWKLEVAGQTFYLDRETCLHEVYRPSFTELLEALPLRAVLSQGDGGQWVPVIPQELARELELDFTPRTFSDLSNSPYREEIDTLACSRLLSGYGDGTFRPQQTITRAEFCAMLSAAFNLTGRHSYTSAFSDVDQGDWYYPSVSAMYAKGFISGYGDGTFRPNGNITYEEVVAILANVSAWACMDGYKYAHTELTEEEQEVYSNFSPWARHAARDLDRFQALLWPQQTAVSATREQAAASLAILMDSIGLFWH